MGADSHIFLFDYKAYSEEVLPAYHEFLLTGEAADWLDPIARSQQISRERWQSVDLRRYCTYLRSDLSWTGPYDETDLLASDWDRRRC